jgi:hypothetical protein
MPTGPYGSSPLPGGGPKIPAIGGFGSTQPVVPPGVTAAGGGSGVLGSIGSWLLDHWEDLAKLGIGAYTTREALQNANAATAATEKSNALTDKALGMADTDYAGRAPFRAAAMTKLSATRPDLSTLFADPGNPYKRGRSAIPVVGGLPMAPTGPTPSVNGYDGPPISGTIGDYGAVPRPIYPNPIGAQSGPISAGPRDRNLRPTANGVR